MKDKIEEINNLIEKGEFNEAYYSTIELLKCFLNERDIYIYFLTISKLINKEEQNWDITSEILDLSDVKDNSYQMVVTSLVLFQYYDLIEKVIEKGINNNISINDSQQYISLLEFNESNFTKCLNLTNLLLEKDPNNVFLINNKAFYLLNLGNEEESLKFIEKGFSLDNNFYFNYYNRGLYFLNKENYSDAIVNFQKCLELNSSFEYAIEKINKSKKLQNKLYKTIYLNSLQNKVFSNLLFIIYDNLLDTTNYFNLSSLNKKKVLFIYLSIFSMCFSTFLIFKLNTSINYVMFISCLLTSLLIGKILFYGSMWIKSVIPIVIINFLSFMIFILPMYLKLDGFLKIGFIGAFLLSWSWFMNRAVKISKERNKTEEKIYEIKALKNFELNDKNKFLKKYGLFIIIISFLIPIVIIYFVESLKELLFNYPYLVIIILTLFLFTLKKKK